MNVCERIPREKNSQAMCSYLQSEQCHSIDLLNLLMASQEMFSLFWGYYCCNASHSVMLKSGFLMWYTTPAKYIYCEHLKMHSQQRQFCNQTYLFVVEKSEWLFGVANCLTEKG